MSNIKDLQKLKGHKYTTNFGQTNFKVFNPQSKINFYEPVLETSQIFAMRISKKMQKYEDDAKNMTKMQFHKRGGSIGTPLLDKQSTIHLKNPRISVYNISAKYDKIGNRQSLSRTPIDFPMTQRKQSDTFFMFNQMPSGRRKSVLNVSPPKREEISKKMFHILYPIGKGGFGKVWKVEMKKNKQVYAMKMMSKMKVINKKSVSSVLNEREFLAKLNHPFLVNMSFAFQDREFLYLIMDYLDGGDLRYHLGNKRFFSEKQAKFYIANILIGLEYLHRNNIIHRDIKPQNLVLDSEGYMRITDLGISREVRQNNYQDTSGTPGYMAPEVMSRRDHSFTADYFALGVIAYECMLGKRPYQGQNRSQIKENILSKQANIRLDELPYRWSPNSIDFVNKLLQRNPQNRLGSNGIEQIKEHPWLADLQWDKILQKKVKSPFRPTSIQEDYDSYKQQISEDTIDENEQETKLMLRQQNIQNLFEGYYCEKTNSNPKDRKFTSFPTNSTEENFRRR